MMIPFIFILLFTSTTMLGATEELSWCEKVASYTIKPILWIGTKLIEIGRNQQVQIDHSNAVTPSAAQPISGNASTPDITPTLESIDSNGKKTNGLLSGGVKTTEHMGLLKQTTCVIGIASGSVYIVKNLCDLGRWTYSFFRKKSVEELQQEALHNEQVSQQLKILTAQNRKDDFVRCCRRCRQAAKDIDGTPLACRKDAQAFLDATSEEEYCKVRNELLAH